MVFKVVLLCVSAFLVQSIAGQPCGCSCGSGSYGSSGYGSSISSNSIGISNSGGDLLVTSVGPISPSGISVNSQLDLNGDLDVNGELPYLTAVQFQGQYDTSGSGSVDYSCGTCGNVAINSIIGGSGSSYGGSGTGCGCSCRA